MKHSDEFRAYFEAVAKYLRDELPLSHYRCLFEYSGEPLTVDLPGGGGIRDALFQTESDPIYRWVKITASPFAQERFWDQGDIEVLAETILHELLHAVTDEVANLALSAVGPKEAPFISAAIERQTVALTSCFKDLLPRGWWLPENVL